ncbi:hypothetical protein PDE_05894 [Penicillium oxalicum 114-2]|uniref:Uncharacterized protein n=1 Tax=Penicillium oxalicum (strain 114-2 / CGMCC 5302) TaxID=933388 RepID=S7ZJZ2_PENO1|nr:hypothetical protein PDE_05894 [Penicillium oxalicum 114-2]
MAINGLIHLVLEPYSSVGHRARGAQSWLSVNTCAKLYLGGLRYIWKQTRSHGFGWLALKLVIASTRLIAVYLAGGGLSSRTGQMDFHGNYGEKFQSLALVSTIALQEKLSRAAYRGSRRFVGGRGAGAGSGLAFTRAAGADA